MREKACYRKFLLLMLISIFFVIANVMFNILEVESADINAITNTIVGKWGYERIMHQNNGTWSTRGGTVTYNSDGTGTDNHKFNDNGAIGSAAESFTYSVIQDQDGSITVTHAYPDNTTRVRKYVVSDDGKIMLMDGTDWFDRQIMRIAVRLDATKTYSNADFSGDCFFNSYYHTLEIPSLHGACSGIGTADNIGNYNTVSSSCNENDSIISSSGPGIYFVNPDGSIRFKDNMDGYLMWNGIGAVLADLDSSQIWDIGMSIKKQDRVYSTSDLAGTWVIEGFGDDRGNSYSSKFGTMTCDSGGNCVGKIKNQRDGNMTYETGNIPFTVASDGSFGASLGDLAPYYAGAIGNNGNTMIFNVSFDSTTLWHREIYVGVKCSKCQSTPFPIAATSSMEFSRGMAFDGTNYLVGLQDDTVDPYIAAQMVSQYGTLVSSKITLNRTGGAPFIAFDGTNYLMVWEDDTTGGQTNRDIYGQFINKSGILVGSYFPISTAPGNQSPDGIVFDGTNYLLIWTDDRNDINGNSSCDIGEGTCTDIYGQFVTTSGNLLGSEIQIDTSPERQEIGAIAFDGTRFLAAWQSQISGYDWDIYGRFITKNGILSTPFIISESPSKSYNPIGISYDGINYLVVWNRDISPGYPNPTIWDIYARLVSPSGTFPGNEFPVTAALRDQIVPFIAFDGSNYLITWTDYRNDINDNAVCDINEGTCVDIYGQYVDKQGKLIGTEIMLNTDFDNQVISPILFASGKYFLVWNNNIDVFNNSTKADVYGQFITKTRFEEFDPAITYTGLWNSYSCSPCSGGALKYSNQTGAKAEFSFNGTGIKWIVAKGPKMGKAKVYLDNVNKGLIDLYSATTKVKQVLQATGLTPGNHTLTIVVSGLKNPSATDKIINIDAFEVVP